MKQTTVYLSIKWKLTEEQVRLDLPSLIKQPKQTIHTREKWDNNRIASLRPRASYSEDPAGNHVIELEYLEADHKDLSEAVYWGVSTVTIDKSLRSAEAHWEGIDKSQGMDGEGYCKLRIEQSSQKANVIVQARRAQGKFKDALIKLDKVCVITGEKIRCLLDAAHIHQVEHGGSDEPDNGLLLRVDLHRLYDEGYFTIDSEGGLIPHAKIPSEYKLILEKKRRLERDVIERVRPYLERRRSPTPQAD